jgi:hypothetical protein
MQIERQDLAVAVIASTGAGFGPSKPARKA